MFGHVKGAFTGAVRDKVGVFQAADGGTLFLDEIGDTSQLLQLKLLRVLQEGEIRRVGDEKSIKVNVRLITATNRDLKNLLATGAMREDFYYRIRVFEITLPPLRERREDIPLLVHHFISEGSKAHRHPVTDIAKDAMQHLMNHSWPGNIRELKNAVEHAFVMMSDDVLTILDLPPELRTHQPAANSDSPALPLTSQQVEERRGILEALEQAKGSKTQAAKLLGMSRVTLWKKINKLGINT